MNSELLSRGALSLEYGLTATRRESSVDYKIISLTYKILTITQRSYLYNIISLFSHIVALVLQIS